MHDKVASNIIKHYKPEYEEVPERKSLSRWVNKLLGILFPLHQSNKIDVEKKLIESKNDFKSLIIQTKKSEEELDKISNSFYGNLEKLHIDLLQDAEAFLSNDPAAKCMGEILHTYPGFYAIAIYRIANFIDKSLNIKYIPRMLTEYAHSKTGIDIHPKAKIDIPFVIDHGTGVVIGETCEIGKNVIVYQGVTLGALQVEKTMQNTKRHPTIEDNVVIYANATILGGNTYIGNHSVIGGNVFLTKSVEPYSLVFSKPQIHVKEINKQEKDIINFVI